MSSKELLLDVRDLAVQFPTEDGIVNAVSGLSFTLRRGETLGIVGESGSGKSVTNLAILGLLNSKRSRITGEILLHGKDLLKASPEELRDVRGKDVAMIFQDPFACLHPMYRVGTQIAEAVRAHADVSKAQAFERSVEVLDAVGIPNARSRARDFPHQFSGGMRQRAMIAMALVHNPAVLIADEPTTALDVTVQAQILELIDKVKRDFDIGVILITHDLGVVAETAQTVMVMYAGRAVEHGPAREVFESPQHPYTWGLLESMPSVEAKVAHLHAIEGSPPSVINLPPGCPFHPRCPHRFDPCDKLRPPLKTAEGGHADACHLDAGRQAPAVGGAPGRARWGWGREQLRRAAHRGRAPDQALPGRLGRVHTPGRRGARGRGRDAQRAPRRDARHRRRVGLRQVDDGTAHAQAARADGGHDPLRWPRHHASQPARHAPHPARDADDLPGPLLVAESAPDGGPDHRAAVLDPQDRGRRARRSCAT